MKKNNSDMVKAITSLCGILILILLVLAVPTIIVYTIVQFVMKFW